MTTDTKLPPAPIVEGSFETGLHLSRVHGWQWQSCPDCEGQGCAECDDDGCVLAYKDREPCGPTCPLNIKLTDNKQ